MEFFLKPIVLVVVPIIKSFYTTIIISRIMTTTDGSGWNILVPIPLPPSTR